MKSQSERGQKYLVGTCFSVRSDDLFITAYHVVESARSIKIHFTDGRSFDVAVEKEAPASDLVLLRVHSSGFEFLPLAPTGSAHVGQPVFTLGFPAISLLGTEPKFTDGSISALSGPGGESSFLQVSVPIQPGNSGGPLVNDQGEVLGIITATAAIKPFLAETGAIPQNVNWAVKADYAAALFEPPHQPAVAGDRQLAIERVRDAICLVEATTK